MTKKEINCTLVDLGIYKTAGTASKNFSDSDLTYYNSKDGIRHVIETNNFTKDELDTAIKVKQLQAIVSIKNMIKFFVILASVGISIYIISFLILLSK